jgi:hypothetical protein
LAGVSPGIVAASGAPRPTLLKPTSAVFCACAPHGASKASAATATPTPTCPYLVIAADVSIAAMIHLVLANRCAQI